MAAIQKATFWEVLQIKALISLVQTLLKEAYHLTQDQVVVKKREPPVGYRVTQVKVTMINNSSR